MWIITQVKWSWLPRGPSSAFMSWNTWAMADRPPLWKRGEREWRLTGSCCIPAECLTQWACSRRGPWVLCASTWLSMILEPRVVVGFFRCPQALSFPLLQRRETFSEDGEELTPWFNPIPQHKIHKGKETWITWLIPLVNIKRVLLSSLDLDF